VLLAPAERPDEPVPVKVNRSLRQFQAAHPRLLLRLASGAGPQAAVIRLEVAAELPPLLRPAMVRQQDPLQGGVEDEAAGGEVRRRPGPGHGVRARGKVVEHLLAQELLLRALSAQTAQQLDGVRVQQPVCRVP